MADIDEYKPDPDEVAALIRQIKDAFDGVPKGNLTIHQAQKIDRYEPEEEVQAVAHIESFCPLAGCQRRTYFGLSRCAYLSRPGVMALLYSCLHDLVGQELSHE